MNEFHPDDIIRIYNPTKNFIVISKIKPSKESGYFIYECMDANKKTRHIDSFDSIIICYKSNPDYERMRAQYTLPNI